MAAQQSEAERKSMELAEESRQKVWDKPSFVQELFMGTLRLDLIHPFPEPDLGRPEFQEILEKVKRFFAEEVDSVAIDRTGEYPPKVVEGLAELGMFGMKIPKEYGGLGFTQSEYARVMKLLGSLDGNVSALISAHQAIGVPQPVKLFGTEEQKKRFLPRCAAGEISGFALTEPDVGSDPGSLATTATPTDDGKAFILNGEKLWCTNGTIAKLLVVMARNPDTQRISAFVVETSWPGVEVAHRCRFMGLKALANGVLTFHDVKVPRENLIGEEGHGLKIALVTLNTGRLTIPAGTVGSAEACLETVRKWSTVREQWGHPIGRHEAIAHQIADIAATTFAMRAVTDYSASAADSGRIDIRLEAAAAKEWNTVQQWRILDETLQIRGGRGYETEDSLAARGEAPIPIERPLRDSRINRIFEGSSEIMHLFMAREAVDKHLEVAGTLIDPKATLGSRLAALPRIAAFYALWYPKLWLSWGRWPRYGSFGPLARHMRFVQRSSRKLARQIFHGMVVYQGGLQRKQGFLFRCVDIACDLYAMAATLSQAEAMRRRGGAEAASARALADAFCASTSRRVRGLFHDLWHNDDAATYRLGQDVLEGRHTWLENEAMGIGYSAEEMRPRRMSDVGPGAPGEETARQREPEPVETTT